MKTKAKKPRIRVPVARWPGRVFRPRKGRGSYVRQQLKKQLRSEARDE